jgi:hypothetical protein
MSIATSALNPAQKVNATLSDTYANFVLGLISDGFESIKDFAHNERTTETLLR